MQKLEAFEWVENEVCLLLKIEETAYFSLIASVQSGKCLRRPSVPILPRMRLMLFRSSFLHLCRNMFAHSSFSLLGHVRE